MRRVDFSSSRKNPGNKPFIKNGIKIWKTKIKINKTKNNIEKTFLTKNNSSFLAFLSWNFSIKIGTNAELKAPSAKIRRKKLGNLKAAKNASDKTLTPKYFAIKISRAKPIMRDNEV